VRPIITTNTDDHIGLAVIRSLGRNNIDFNVVSKTKDTLGCYSRYSRNKLVSQFSMDFFSKLSKDDVVFPMIEDIMLLLLKNQSKLKCQLGFSNYETIQMARDKSLLTQHAIKQKIPCPKTIFITKPDDFYECISEIEYPVVFKPSCGAGGKGIQFLDSAAQHPEISEWSLSENNPGLLQEKIPYDERYSVAILMNFSHNIRRCCVLRALRCHPMNTGPASFVESVDRPDLVKMGETLLKSINFQGIAEVEFVIDSRDNTPKLMEVNPRFWGSTQAAINAGVDFPYLLHRMLEDGDIEKNLSYNLGIRCRYVLFNDLFRLINVLRGDSPIAVKRKNVTDFLKFNEDNGYYVYSPDDIMPFFGLANIKLLKKWTVLKNGFHH
jgi:predicted ATP-grasp superfamily ATP-dependent carboligase